MKDLKIKGTWLKREIYILLGCLGVAEVLNIFSIIKFKTNWGEVITQLHFVILVGLFMYVVVFILQHAYRGIVRLVRK